MRAGPMSYQYSILKLDWRRCWPAALSRHRRKMGQGPMYVPSSQIQVAPPSLSTSLQHGTTSSACSGLSRKCIKKSPSTCQLSSSLGGMREPSSSGEPRFTMKPSPQVVPLGAMRSSPPRSSQMADQALGAIWATGMRRWEGMLLRGVVHVDLSLGSL